MAEWLEVVGLCLIREDVSIHQKEDSFLRPGLPQSPNDLKRSICFSGACSHHQQDAVLALCDGFNGPINGSNLIVARSFPRAIFVVRLGREGFLSGCPPFRHSVSRPKFIWRRERIQRDLTCHDSFFDGTVVLEKCIAIRTVSEWYIENLGIIERLLHASANRVVIVLRLDDRDRLIGLVVEDIVCLLRHPSFDLLPTDNDLPLCEKEFLPDLRHHVPFITIRTNERRCDELRADIGFCKGLFVHDRRAFLILCAIDCPVLRLRITVC